ncbi:MAG: methyltransferase domain-containing protein [Snowella sp.]|nr:methyltransferase domain-containing protein [Snowella sp.]
MPSEINLEETSPDIEAVISNGTLKYTGERHMIGVTGIDLSWGNIEHLIRYAFVTPFIQGKKVLDIACGSGYGSQYMALQGAEQVVGVDIEQQAIDYARKFHNHDVIRYIQSDAQSVPELADDSFDVIVSFETIEHVQHPMLFLTELRRLLKPEGQIFMSCPNDYRISPWISEFHVHKFRFNEFRDLFLSVFGEGTFLGQHTVLGNCLLLPQSLKEKTVQFESYKQSLPNDFFEQEYLEDASSIENADGYFVASGVEPNVLGNTVSISQTPMRSIMLALGALYKNQSQIELLQEQLSQTQSELHQAHSQSEQAQSELHQTCSQLDQTQSELHQTRSQLDQTQSELHQTRSQLDQTQSELHQTRSQLDQTQSELHQTRSQLDQTQSEFHQTRSQLDQTQSELHQARSQLDQTQSELHQARSQLDQTQSELEQVQYSSKHLKVDYEEVQNQLLQYQERIAAMESSKFWKLRKIWFQFKHKCGLKE